MRVGPPVVSVTAIAYASFAHPHAPKPHELQGEQDHEHDVQANQHARLGHSLYTRMADAPRTRKKQQDSEDEKCRTKSGVNLVAPLACGSIGGGAEACKPDEPENTKREKEERDDGRVMHG